MARPGTPPGSHGKVSFSDTGIKGTAQFRARTRYRPLDGGALVPIEARGKTTAAAERALKAKITTAITADETRSAPLTLAAAVPRWHEELIASQTVAYQTSSEYMRLLRATVLPQIGYLEITALSAGVLTRFLQGCIHDGKGYSLAENSKTVLLSVLAWCVREDIIPANPARDAQIPKRPRTAERTGPRALSLDQVRTVRDACAEADGVIEGKPGPRTNRNLIDGLDLMLSTGMRIGELCGLTWADVDLLAEPPVLHVNGTYVDVVEDKHDMASHRQDRPKTPTSVRTIILDDFAVAVLLDRQTRPLVRNEVNAVFPSRTGGFLTPNGWRHRWRNVRAKLGPEYEWITPHSMRDTVATIVADTSGVETAADLLGHSSPAITRKHYWDRTQSGAPDTRAVTAGLRG